MAGINFINEEYTPILKFRNNMETMVEKIAIISTERLNELQDIAIEYTKKVIGVDDFTEISSLKYSLLMEQEKRAYLNLDMMKREKKREAQHRDEIERLKDQIESLAQQVGRLSKNNK
jgi:hypothetical protein